MSALDELFDRNNWNIFADSDIPVYYWIGRNDPVAIEAYAELSDLRTALEEAKEVVSNITNKMDVIADSHEYISIFQMAKIHGLEYTGDNWGNEYEKAKLWLSKWGDK